jgi:hypothetical protein
LCVKLVMALVSDAPGPTKLKSPRV